jgi:mono/diheme cytochrome c family protein
MLFDASDIDANYVLMSIGNSMKMRFLTTLGLTAALCCAMVLSARPTLAQDTTVMSASGELTSGKRDFMEYCAQCHGKDAKGEGPVAPTLKKKPANLTLLSKNNDGTFPERQVREFIDGGKFEAAHGTREMPIWGYAFLYRKSSRSGPGGAQMTDEEVQQKIGRLIAYIRTLQVE